MEKIGVLGGTFDPVHIGHLMLADQAASSFGLSKVLFIPSGAPPHKDALKISAAVHRMEMVRLAIMDNVQYEASDIECGDDSVSYTYKTLEALNDIYGRGAALYYIIGSDVLRYITKFRNCKRVFGSCVLLATTRPGGNQKETEAIACELVRLYGARIELMKFPEIGISSSLIRSKISNGESVRYMLPGPVIDYIGKNNLYTIGEETSIPGYWESIPEPHVGGAPVIEVSVIDAPIMDATRRCGRGGQDVFDCDKIKRMMASKLSIKRFRHSLGVAKIATRLAGCLGADQVSAETAGLLHDCMRETPFDELISICEAGEVPMTEFERGAPVILHAAAGAVAARKLLEGASAVAGTAGERADITRAISEIEEAIACHTTGRGGMGLLAKIIYVADAIEPGRDYEAAREARAMLSAGDGAKIDEERLDAVALYLIEKNIEHIQKKGHSPHPDTIRARNWLATGCDRISMKI